MPILPRFASAPISHLNLATNQFHFDIPLSSVSASILLMVKVAFFPFWRGSLNRFQAIATDLDNVLKGFENDLFTFAGSSSTPNVSVLFVYTVRHYVRRGQNWPVVSQLSDFSPESTKDKQKTYHVLPIFNNSGDKIVARVFIHYLTYFISAACHFAAELGTFVCL